MEAAALENWVFICEGEKDVDNLLTVCPNLIVTTNPKGSAYWSDSFTAILASVRMENARGELKGQQIVLVSDLDNAGRTRNTRVGKELTEAGCRVLVCNPPGDEGSDISDWLLADQPPTTHDVREWILAATEWVDPEYISQTIAEPDLESSSAPMFSDSAITSRFTHLYKEQLRYCAIWREWMVWCGTHWKKDQVLGTYNKARLVTNEIAFSLVESAKQGEKVGSLPRQIASAKTINSIERIARSDPVFVAEPAQFDRENMIFNTPSGELDLETGKNRGHHRESMITKISKVSLGSSCRNWERFIDLITAGDVELANYLQRLAGYCLTGDTREAAFFFFYGIGGNGKSTFLETLRSVMGEDFVRNVDMGELIESHNATHPTGMAALRGARLAIASETSKGRSFDDAKIKKLTGGDSIPARFMHRDWFDFIPQFKLIIFGNYRPHLRTVDPGMRRRLHMVPFLINIKETLPPSEFKLSAHTTTLAAERPGILGWMLAGCKAWMEQGLAPPTAVTSATNEYFMNEDVLTQWKDEQCKVDRNSPYMEYSVTALFKDWTQWCGLRNDAPGTQRDFTSMLSDTGFRKKRKANGYFLTGIALKEDGGYHNQD